MKIRLAVKDLGPFEFDSNFSRKSDSTINKTLRVRLHLSSRSFYCLKNDENKKLKING